LQSKQPDLSTRAKRYISSILSYKTFWLFILLLRNLGIQYVMIRTLCIWNCKLSWVFSVYNFCYASRYTFMSRNMVKLINLEKSKRLTIWNGGSTKYNVSRKAKTKCLIVRNGVSNIYNSDRNLYKFHMSWKQKKLNTNSI
jgi:hypothetical protein